MSEKVKKLFRDGKIVVFVEENSLKRGEEEKIAELVNS